MIARSPLRPRFRLKKLRSSRRSGISVAEVRARMAPCQIQRSVSVIWKPTWWPPDRSGRAIVRAPSSRSRRSLSRNPAFADAWTLLGRAYDLSGRYEDAVNAYRRTIDVSPLLAPGTALSLAEVYLKLGQFQEALDHADLARRCASVECRAGASTCSDRDRSSRRSGRGPRCGTRRQRHAG